MSDSASVASEAVLVVQASPAVKKYNAQRQHLNGEAHSGRRSGNSGSFRSPVRVLSLIGCARAGYSFCNRNYANGHENGNEQQRVKDNVLWNLECFQCATEEAGSCCCTLWLLLFPLFSNNEVAMIQWIIKCLCFVIFPFYFQNQVKSVFFFFFFFGSTTVVGQGLPVPLVGLAFSD